MLSCICIYDVYVCITLYVMYIGDFMVWRGHDHIPSYEVSLLYTCIVL